LEKKKITFILQFLFIIVYLILFFGFSNLLFLKTIFGIIFLLFIPGYNLIELLFPDFSLKLRLGLCSIFSLGLDILIMLIYYIIGVSFLNGNPFFFNIEFLVILFSIISFLLNLLNFLRNNDNKIRTSTTFNKQEEKFYFQFKKNKFYIILALIFILDLMLLCFNVYLNRVSLPRDQILYQYSANLTFFLNCDFYFYIFYSLAIILLIFFAVKFENKIVFLSFVCVFLFVQLIIPYLQIGDFFSLDAIFLEESIHYYNTFGITPVQSYGLNIIIDPVSLETWELRYATSTFYGILLVNLTGMDIFFSLSFLYPLSVCLTPFFIYGLLENISNHEKMNEENMKILTFFSIFNPFFLKLSHTATTTVIGFIIFLVLIFLLYIIFRNQDLSIKYFVIVIFLYLFLCFTHIEEALYYLPIFIVVEFFFIIIKSKKLSTTVLLSKNEEDTSFFKRYCILFGILVLLYYISQEFLGYFSNYISFFDSIPLFNIIFTLYSDSKFLSFPFIFENFINLSVFMLIICVLIPFLLYFLYYIIKLNKPKLEKFGVYFYKILKKIQDFILKKRPTRLFQFFIILFLVFAILFLNFFVFKFLQFEGIFILLEIPLIYSFYIIQMFILCKNLLFYKINRLYEYFFLIIIISLTASFGFFGLFSNRPDYILYDLQKLLYIIIFFNIFLIKANYFDDLSKKKYKYFFVLFFIMIIGGLNISFRKLKYG